MARSKKRSRKPARQGTDQPSTEEQSTAFVEHLRLVHFTLVLACAGILVALSSDRQTELTRASRQLDIVRKMDDAARRAVVSTGGGLTDWLIYAAKSTLPIAPPTRDGLIYRPSWAEDTYTLIGQADITIGASQYPVVTEFEVPYWRLRDSTGGEITKSSARVRETRVNDFILFWNLLNDVAFELADRVDRVEVYVRKDLGSQGVLGAPIEYSRSVPLEPPTQPIAAFTDQTLAFFEEGYAHKVPKLGSGDIRVKADYPGTHPDYPSTLAAWPSEIESALREHVFAAKIHFSRREFNPQLALTQLVGVPLPPGEFDSVFPELAAFVHDLGTITLTDAAVVIHREQTSTPDSVEMLGLKLPVQSLAGWGTVAILSVQLYFWLHMHELLRRSKNGRLSQVFWIGTYPNGIARVIFVATACIGPPTTLVYVSRSSIIDIGLIGVFGGAVALSTCLALLTVLDWFRLSRAGVAE